MNGLIDQMAAVSPTAAGLSLNGQSAPAGIPSPIDLSRVLYDVNTSFNPLHNDCLLDFQVSGARDGIVFLTIALPEGMTRVFVAMLESLTGFFRVIDVKSRAAAASAAAQKKSHDPAEIARREKVYADFQSYVCSLFDGFVKQGMDRKEAVKHTNAELKAKNHPWAGYETVTSVLSAAGRFRKKQVHQQG